MKYDFTRQQLEYIHDVMELNGEFGPRAAFRFFHNFPESTAITTPEVEDFSVAFMSQYNATFGATY